MTYLSSIYLVFSLATLNYLNTSNSRVKIDSVFVRWNTTTIQSLETQSRIMTDSAQKFKYENRLSSLKSYWQIENVRQVNINSIRYKFLSDLYLRFKLKSKDFYLIESNSTNSSIQLRIFVVYPKTQHIVDVDFYIFSQGNWEKKGQGTVRNFNLTSDLKLYFAKYPSGFNEEDIIISKFKNNNIESSEYYLYGTLSISSGVNEVIDTYNSKNFLQIN